MNKKPNTEGVFSSVIDLGVGWEEEGNRSTPMQHLAKFQHSTWDPPALLPTKQKGTMQVPTSCSCSASRRAGHQGMPRSSSHICGWDTTLRQDPPRRKNRRKWSKCQWKGWHGSSGIPKHFSAVINKAKGCTCLIKTGYWHRLAQSCQISDTQQDQPW